MTSHQGRKVTSVMMIQVCYFFGYLLFIFSSWMYFKSVRSVTHWFPWQWKSLNKIWVTAFNYYTALKRRQPIRFRAHNRCRVREKRKGKIQCNWSKVLYTTCEILQVTSFITLILEEKYHDYVFTRFGTFLPQQESDIFQQELLLWTLVGPRQGITAARGHPSWESQ